MTSDIQLLKQCALLEQITEDDLRKILGEKPIQYAKKDEVLFRQNDSSDTMYILIEGYMKSLLRKSDNIEKVVGFIHSGETIGDVEFLDNIPRHSTVTAVTDCKLLQLSMTQYEKIKKLSSEFINELLNHQIAKIKTFINFSKNTTLSKDKFIFFIDVDKNNNSAQITDLIKLLIGKNCKFIDSKESENIFLQNDLISIFKFLNDLERNYEQIFILTNENIFKQRHIIFKKADSIILLADCSQSPNNFKYVKNYELNNLYERKTRIMLVLNWSMGSRTIHGTSAWVKDYNIDNVFHIQNIQNDTERLVRFLTGNAIGVVLSGGFSLVWAQVGFLKYLEEKNIPIDFIAGTSSGAGIAAIYLISDSIDELIKNMNILSDSIDHTASIKSATWPIVALFDGKEATESVKRVFGRKHIEDLPIPYLAVSANLNKETEVLHKKGLIWKAVRCSCSAPVLLPPVIENGDVIVDGGLLNNLPCDHVRNILGKSATIIAFDLGLQNEDNHHYYFPPHLATSDFIKNKLSSKRRYDTPPFFRTLIRSMMLGSTAKQHENVKFADYYIAPDLSKFSMLEFDSEKIKQLIEIGYKTTKKVLKNWNKDDE